MKKKNKSSPDKNRTYTPIQERDFKSLASTNSATGPLLCYLLQYFEFRRDDWTRTSDLMLPKHACYQLHNIPNLLFVLNER